MKKFAYELIKKVFVISSLLMLGNIFLSTPVLAEVIVLKYTDGMKSGTTRTRAAKDTMLEIEKRTNGRVKHEFYWAQSLLKAKDALQGIKMGTSETGNGSGVVYHPARFPTWQFVQLLFLTGDDQYAHTKALNELYETNEVLRNEVESQGLVLLSHSGMTPSIMIGKKPLNSIGDFEGARLRVIGPQAKWMAAMGASTVPMKFYETVEALSRGIIDGMSGYVFAFHGYKQYEYCKYLNTTGINHLTIDYYINVNALNRMPPDIRKIYVDTWREFYPKLLVEYTDKARAKQIEDFKKAGVKMYSWPSELVSRFKKYTTPVNQLYFDKMKKRAVNGEEVVAQYWKLYKKYKR